MNTQDKGSQNTNCFVRQVWRNILVDRRSSYQSTDGLGAAGFQAGDEFVFQQLDRLSGATPGQLTHRHFVA